MSEIIDNVSKRQEQLKTLIQRLHRGEDRAAVEAEFKRDFAYVTGAEIAQMEYNLVQDGVSVEEIQSLCDVHASLFQGSLAELHQDVLTVNPITMFEDENAEFSALVDKAIKFKQETNNNINVVKPFLLDLIEKFRLVDAHYAKKENVFFPFLEKHGIETIPQVMWGVDNQIREKLKDSFIALNTSDDVNMMMDKFYQMVDMVKEMITKENMILFPLLRDTLTENDFKAIAQSLENPEAGVYQSKDEQASSPEEIESVNGDIRMSLGHLSTTEVNAILNTLPFDMTFVDANDKVKYVSQGKERIFDRPASVIGRPVHLCHPPQSVHVVMNIVEDLRSGKKDHEDFWINFRGKFVFIRYYAVRGEAGEYLGCIEVTQEISEIRSLEGEKRLAS
ncbi:MAG: DUF438 domain-containing protein [Erysipelotrichaceae bacterium]|jgi:uncharacterized protein